MLLLGFTLGLIISILCLVVYLIIENTILKRDLLDALEELGTRERDSLTTRRLIGFITPKKTKEKEKKKK